MQIKLDDHWADLLERFLKTNLPQPTYCIRLKKLCVCDALSTCNLLCALPWEIQKIPCNPTYIDLINKIRIKPRPGIVPVKSTGNYILRLHGPWLPTTVSTVHLNSPTPHLTLKLKQLGSYSVTAYE